jgi:hypothetical protein
MTPWPTATPATPREEGPLGLEADAANAQDMWAAELMAAKEHMAADKLEEGMGREDFDAATGAGPTD